MSIVLLTALAFGGPALSCTVEVSGPDAKLVAHGYGPDEDAAKADAVRIAHLSADLHGLPELFVGTMWETPESTAAAKRIAEGTAGSHPGYSLAEPTCEPFEGHWIQARAERRSCLSDLGPSFLAVFKDAAKLSVAERPALARRGLTELRDRVTGCLAEKRAPEGAVGEPGNLVYCAALLGTADPPIAGWGMGRHRGVAREDALISMVEMGVHQAFGLASHGAGASPEVRAGLTASGWERITFLKLPSPTAVQCVSAPRKSGTLGLAMPGIECAEPDPVVYDDVERAPELAATYCSRVVSRSWTGPADDAATWKSWANLMMCQSLCESTLLPASLTP